MGELIVPTKTNDVQSALSVTGNALWTLNGNVYGYYYFSPVYLKNVYWLNFSFNIQNSQVSPLFYLDPVSCSLSSIGITNGTVENVLVTITNNVNSHHLMGAHGFKFNNLTASIITFDADLASIGPSDTYTINTQLFIR
jgi:hypothetical protein